MTTPSASSPLQAAAAALASRDWEGALSYLHEAVRRDPALETDPDWIHDAAMCHFHLGRKQEALLGLDRAALLQPAYGYRFASRAWLRQALGDLAGARADYERAIALDPEDAISLNNLGLLEEQMGYRQEARRRFEVADELRSVLESSGIAIEPSSDPSKDASDGLSAGLSAGPSGGASAEIRDPLPAQHDPSRTPWSVGEFLRFVRNGFKLKP